MIITTIDVETWKKIKEMEKINVDRWSI